MVDLSSLLSDEDLRRRYGTPTLDRAWDYVRRGHVLTCTHELDGDGDLDIRGTVSGSTSAPYVVTLSVGVDGEGVWVFGRCSCPVGDGCKHSLALLITVRDEQQRERRRRAPGVGSGSCPRCSTSSTGARPSGCSASSSRSPSRSTSSHRPARPGSAAGRRA